MNDRGSRDRPAHLIEGLRSRGSNSNSRRRVIYRGSKIDLALQAVPLADGTYAEREVVIHRGAVALVPWSTASTFAWWKTNAMRSARHCWKFPPARSTPASRPSRRPCASLQEETGYRAGTDRAHPRVVCFAGLHDREECISSSAKTWSRAARTSSPTSGSRPVIVPWEDALAMASDGRIEDAKTMLALSICDRLKRK